MYIIGNVFVDLAIHRMSRSLCGDFEWIQVILYDIVYAEFAEYPVNITLPTGSETNAVFRCQHQSLEAIIDWRVNGLPRRRFPNITISAISENGIIVDLMVIPARVEYNGTEVECVAIFMNGSQPKVTPPATLTIIAGLILTTHLIHPS